MKKFLFASIAALALGAASLPALADPPDGTFVFKDNTDYTKQGNQVGQLSARIIQNGQFVSGNCGCGIDQTTTPGSRADAVHSLLGH